MSKSLSLTPFSFPLAHRSSAGNRGGKRSIYVSGGVFTQAFTALGGPGRTPPHSVPASGIPVHAGESLGWLPGSPPYAESSKF